jgi:hypothetical protein
MRSGLRGFRHGRTHGVGNVVILQVEKHLPPRGHEVPNDLRTFSGIELHPDFVSQGGVSDGRHNLLGGCSAGNIQRNDEPLARIIVALKTVARTIAGIARALI